MWDGVATAGLHACDLVLHEALLFAAIMFFVGGVDDLLVDLAYVFCRQPAATLADIPDARTEPLAIFVGAWDEQAVIGAMLVAGQKSWPFNRQFLLDSTKSAPSMQPSCSAPSAPRHRA